MAEVFPENNLSDEFSASYDLSIALFLILTKNLSLVFFSANSLCKRMSITIVHLLFTLTSHYS